MWRDLAREGGGGPCVVKRDFFLLCPLGHGDLFPTAPAVLQALGRALGRSHGDPVFLEVCVRCRLFPRLLGLWLLDLWGRVQIFVF